MSFAIIFMLTGTTRSFATWSLNIWSTRTADTTWLADLDVLLKLMWRYTVRVKLSNAKSFIKVNLNHFVNLLFFTRSKRLPSRVNRWEEEALGPWWNSQVTNSKDFINIKRWKTSQTSVRIWLLLGLAQAAPTWNVVLTSLAPFLDVSDFDTQVNKNIWDVLNSTIQNIHFRSLDHLEQWWRDLQILLANTAKAVNSW